VIAAPSKIDLAPGTYTVPGLSYRLVVSGPGAALVCPTVHSSLIDMVTPANAPATTPAKTPSTWLVVVAGLLLGGLGVHLWRNHVAPDPAPVPAPVIPTPAPTPQPEPKPRPDWLSKEEPPATKPVNFPASKRAPALEWRTLPWAPSWEGFGRDVDGTFLIARWRALQKPQPARGVVESQPQAEPVVVPYLPMIEEPRVIQPRQINRIPYCTTGTCPTR
jgi:hypothetical protein